LGLKGTRRQSGAGDSDIGVIKKSGLAAIDYRLLGTIAAVCVTFALALVKYSAVTSYTSFDYQDGAAFLYNAAYLAGLHSSFLIIDGYPPAFPLLLSLLFRVNGPAIADGWALSIALFFVSMVACFWISRRMMNPYFAVMASVSFGLSPQVYEWAGMIITNVEGVAIAATAFAALVYATRANKWIYLVGFPLVALASLTRFTMITVIIPAAIYLVLERSRVRQKLRFVLGGLIMFALTAVIVSYQWIATAISQNDVGELLPPPLTGQNTLGGTYYVVHFATDLAPGVYGVILSALFVCSVGYIAYETFRKKYSRIDPAIYALLAWFLALFLYYSLLWPSPALRYSLDFAMPVMILGFWFLSKVFGVLRSQINSKAGKSKPYLALLLVAAVVIGTSYPAFASAVYVTTTPPYSYQPDYSQLNVGVSQAYAWLQGNVNSSVRIAANGGGWLFQAMAPRYIVDPFYPGSDCNSLKRELAHYGDGYLVIIPAIYVGDDSGCPFSSIQTNATFWESVGVTPIQVISTEQGNITIFRVV